MKAAAERTDLLAWFGLRGGWKWLSVPVYAIVAAWVFADWWTWWQLDRYWKREASAGRAVWMDDLMKAPLPPDAENAAIPLKTAAGLCSEVENAVLSADPSLKRPDQSAPLVWRKLEKSTAYEDSLKEADRLSGYGVDRSPNKPANDPAAAITPVELAASNALLDEGRVDESLLRTARLLRFRRAGSRTGFSLETFHALATRLRAANRALRSPKLGAAARSTFLQSLEELDSAAPWAATHRRYAVYVARFAPRKFWVPRFMENRAALRLCEAIDAQPQWDSRPFSEFKPHLLHDMTSNFDSPYILSMDSGFVARMLDVRRECDEFRAYVRCFRALAALNGKAPDTKIEDLGLAHDSITDPFDGKPLRIVYGTEGPTVYSVGWDLADGEGKIGTFNGIYGWDIGVGPSFP